MSQNQQQEFEVIVIGGGTAGVIAAVQAGRAGAKALLVEKNGMLGGTVTVGAVNFPGCFHTLQGEQVIAGIGWELAKECVAVAGDKMPEFKPAARCGQQQFGVNRAFYAALCDRYVRESGADLLLHAMPATIEKRDSGWRVTLCERAGLRDVCAKVLIDCTGDALAAEMAGCGLIQPEVTQPATLVGRVSGYDPKSLDMESINEAFKKEVKGGRLRASDANWKLDPAVDHWIRCYGGNSGHIPHGEARTSAGRTRLEVDARASFLRLFEFLKKQPGLENLRADFLAAECGVRETAVIKGRETVTLKDYFEGRQWEDAVCYSYYAIDLHQLEGNDYRLLPEGVIPSVPRGALLPQGVNNLIVAGRCLSSDRLANSALRIEATCMATGQAAGAMAALAARKNAADAGGVPMEAIRRLLEDHGAIVPEPAVP